MPMPMCSMPLLAALCALLPGAPAAAAQGGDADGATRLRFAKTFLPGTKDFTAMKIAAEKIRGLTQGAVSVEWVDVDMTTDVVADLLAGRIHIAAVPTMALAEHAEGVLPFGLPGLFDADADLRRVDERLGGRVEALLQDAGMHTLARIDRGFTYLLSVGEIRTPADLERARLWLPEGRSFASLSAAIVARTVHAPLVDVPKHLARARAGDAEAANALIAWPTMAILQGWNEHLTDVLMVPMFPVDLRLVLARDAYATLDAAQRAVLTNELGRALDEIARTSAQNDREWPRIMERFGARMHRPADAEAAAWRAWAVGVQDRAVAGNEADARTLAEIRAALDA